MHLSRGDNSALRYLPRTSQKNAEKILPSRESTLLHGQGGLAATDCRKTMGGGRGTTNACDSSVKY